VDLQGDDVTVGDCYVLCSDGLSGMIEDSEILEIVSKSPSIEEACRKLIAVANEHGGEDNITAVLVRIEEEPGTRVPEKVRLSDTLPTMLTVQSRQAEAKADDAHADTPPAGETKDRS
jgi:serine/threonine protein phosphatase PrpC